MGIKNSGSGAPAKTPKLDQNPPACIKIKACARADVGRGILVKLGRLGGRTESTVLDTHPAGPERVAAWDLAAAEIRSGSPMPRKR